MNEKIKIAIADDHPNVAIALKKLLEVNGFEVIIEAGNGRDLILQIENSSVTPDACIIDGNMPVMNGSETASAVKKKWPEIQIIGFSMDKKNGEDMLEMGADAFISKSSPTEMIVDTIRKLRGNV